MELVKIVERYAEAISAVDEISEQNRANPRTGEIYLPGAKSMSESELVKAIDKWWGETHPDDFGTATVNRVGIPYPEISRTKCDQIIPSKESNSIEWAIEVKNITLIGNNGKKNDFAVSKMLSPFLKDRSLLHDVVRLRKYSLAEKHAVIGYSFKYDSDTCKKAIDLHPERNAEIQNIKEVCIANGGLLSVEPLLEFADGIMRVRGLIAGPLITKEFEAWRHPCGGKGLVFGWEVRRPELEASFDPRHPW